MKEYKKYINEVSNFNEITEEDSKQFDLILKNYNAMDNMTRDQRDLMYKISAHLKLMIQ